MWDALETIGIFLIIAGLALSWRFGEPTGDLESEPPRNRLDASVGGILILVGLAFTARGVFAA